jgi:hypothetical protein
MPPQQSIWRRDRGKLPQGRTTDLVCARGQAAAIFIREPRPPSAKLTPQKPILFDQVRDGLPLPTVQPAGQRHHHDLQRGGIDHESDLVSWPARKTSADLWNRTSSCTRRKQAYYYARWLAPPFGGEPVSLLHDRRRRVEPEAPRSYSAVSM